MANPTPAAPALAPGLLERAQRARVTRDDVVALADALRGAPDVRATIAALLPALSPPAATALLLAGAMAGARPAPADVGPLLPRLLAAPEVALLVGALEEEARLPLLLGLLEEGGLPLSAEARIIFHTVDALCFREAPECRVLPPGAAPPIVRARTRLLARIMDDAEGEMLLAAAAEAMGDPEVRAVVADLTPKAEDPAAQKLLQIVHVLGRMGPLAPDALPSRDAREPRGLPFQREGGKVGRNEPCPCGSGRKFKKCCEGTAGDPSEADDSSPEDFTRAAARAQLKTFDRLPVDYLHALDLAALPTTHVISAAEAFSQWWFFEEAERALAIAESRADADGALDDLRVTVVNDAEVAGNMAVARRVLARITRKESEDNYRLDRALLEGRADLALIEDEVARALREPDEAHLEELAYALLRHRPALGIVVARAALTAAERSRTEGLLEEIEEARDRLLLPPDDPAWETFEQLTDEQLAGENEEDDRDDEDGRERAALREQAKALREEADRAAARVRDLERRLRAHDAEIAAAPAPGPAEGEEIRRLRAKNDELKSLIEEGNRERRGLRRDLATLATRLAETPARKAEGEDEGADEEDLLEADAAPPELGLLLPCYSDRAREALERLPADVARKALMEAAMLAGADGDTWRAAKRLQRRRDVWSIRVAGRYRLLFRPSGAARRLDVLDVIFRRDLEAAIRSLT
jgi:hypothetical protein